MWALKILHEKNWRESLRVQEFHHPPNFLWILAATPGFQKTTDYTDLSVVPFFLVFWFLLAGSTTGCPDMSSTVVDTVTGEMSLSIRFSRSRVSLSRCVIVGDEDELEEDVEQWLSCLESVCEVWLIRSWGRTRWQAWNHDRDEVLRFALYPNLVFNEMCFFDHWSIHKNIRFSSQSFPSGSTAGKTLCLPKSSLLLNVFSKNTSWEELVRESLRSGTLSSTRFSLNSCSHWGFCMSELFREIGFGGFMSWKTQPNCRVFDDLRPTGPCFNSWQVSRLTTGRQDLSWLSSRLTKGCHVLSCRSYFFNMATALSSSFFLDLLLGCSSTWRCAYEHFFPKSATALGVVEQAFWRVPLFTEWIGASSFEVILAGPSRHSTTGTFFLWDFEFSTHFSHSAAWKISEMDSAVSFFARLFISCRKLQLSRLEHCPLASHCQQSPRILCTRCFTLWFLTTALVS